MTGIRGSGLHKLDATLADLIKNPQELNRSRFNRDFSYLSSPSHSTLSNSPSPRNDEQRRHDEQQAQLLKDRAASLPNKQLEAQVNEEEERIIAAVEDHTLRVPPNISYREFAYKTVKEKWVAQGIWNDNWNDKAYGLWKHEEPKELTDLDLRDRPTGLFCSSKVAPTPTRQTNASSLATSRDGRSDRDASRPFNQFIYQVSMDCEGIQDKMTTADAATLVPANIYTTAYEKIKRIWIQRGIWDVTWGILPGVSWKHERPLDAMLDGLPASTVTSGNPGQYPDLSVKSLETTKRRRVGGPVVRGARQSPAAQAARVPTRQSTRLQQMRGHSVSADIPSPKKTRSRALALQHSAKPQGVSKGQRKPRRWT